MAVVIPSYNAPNVAGVVDEIFEVAMVRGLLVEVHVVDDGSAVAVNLVNRPGLYVYRGENQGKGAALRFGLAQSTCAVRGFVDADGDYDPNYLMDMAEIVRSGRADVVVGRRSVAGVAWPRRVMSCLFRLWVHLWHGLDVETQAGIKMFSHELLDRVLDGCVVDGFAFDVEILARSRYAGLAPAVELAVDIRPVDAPTTVSLRGVVRALSDVARVAR